ncbi:MAG: permease-like cell division protein FtsX [Gammaproteobacteria bacterium]|nr:permease-like cell division protein FtsX [Gammaproteobacteria bacterium]
MKQSEELRNQGRRGILQTLRTYILRHAQVLFYSLGRMTRAPLSSFMTITVIGIALALPSGLNVLVTNAQLLSGSWQGAARISLFLEKSLSDAQVEELQGHILALDDVSHVDFISPAQALLEFRDLSGFGEALDALEENPLPAVFVVHPVANVVAPEQVETLVERLRVFPGVDLIQLDTQWLKRLYAILEITQRGILVLSGLFALAVIIIVGNTIRLDIQNRREEIVVIKLIGGTDAFIRRPFLYGGFWYGFGGAAMAWILVTVSLWLMAEPIRNLAGLYGSSFALTGLDTVGLTAVFGTGSLLGWLGSWVAVSRHLRMIEPS